MKALAPQMLLGSQPTVEWKGVSLQFRDNCAMERRLGVALSWLTDKEATDCAVPQDRAGGDAEGQTKSRDIGEGTRDRTGVWKLPGQGWWLWATMGECFRGKVRGYGRP